MDGFSEKCKAEPPTGLGVSDMTAGEKVKSPRGRKLEAGAGYHLEHAPTL
jgi:hypothetical protein